VAGTITDNEPGGSGVKAGSAAYVVMDEYGQIQPHSSLTLGEGGQYVFTVALEASRLGNDPDGRHYTIAVSAQDNAKNLGVASTLVTVPHEWGPCAACQCSSEHPGSSSFLVRSRGRTCVRGMSQPRQYPVPWMTVANSRRAVAMGSLVLVKGSRCTRLQYLVEGLAEALHPAVFPQ
jgi:hypothetical protein